MTLLAGLDIGTTSIKAVIYTPDGQAVARASAPTPVAVPRPGWAYYEAEIIWRDVCTVLRAAVDGLPDPGAVVGIAVTSVGEAIVPLDRHGQPTSEVIAWFDNRTRPQAEWLDRVIGKDVLFARSGLSLQPIFSLCKLLWLKQERPADWARTTRWLLLADYIAWRLSGEQGTGQSLASRTLLLNLHRFEWDADTLYEAGIDRELLAPVVPGGTPLGPLTAEASRATGLPQSCRVSTGGHDHVCGAFAAGVTKPGQMLNSLGTAEALFLALERPIADPEAGRQGYTQGAHVVGDKPYVFGGQYTSGASVSWMRDILQQPGAAPLDYESLIAEAATVPPGSLGVCFLPHLRLANPPYDDPRSRGSFIGLSADVTRGTLMRAVLEGIAFETRSTLDPLLAYPEVDPPVEIVAIGGGTKNGLLMEIKASIMGRPIEVLSAEEATALGAALLGGLGAGVYGSVAEAVAAPRFARGKVEPDPVQIPIYQAMYDQVFLPFYHAVAPLSHAIVALQSRAGS